MRSNAPPARPAVPLCTYRLQLNRGFTFAQATQIVPYLHALGVSDAYLSPYLQARPGSLHGYDITNHGALNPEIGDEASYRALVRALRQHNMGQVADIVPNHMGIAGGANPWWLNVLENGPSSPFAPYFDIEWEPLQPKLRGKVLLPVLGDQFGLVLERGELQLAFEDGRFHVCYFENRFPASPRSTAGVLREALGQLDPAPPEPAAAAERAPDLLELESIIAALEHLPMRDRTEPACVAERSRERIVSRRRLAALVAESPRVRRAIDTAVTLYNGTPAEPHSFDRLEALLEDQPYRLAFWRVAAEEINYRRFFDINDLAGVRAERPEVFQQTHRLILQLLQEGAITGLRVDHPDGLYDPRGYFRRLYAGAEQRSDGAEPYVLIEKILTGDEELPEDWPVSGTVGYEFMARLNQLFVAPQNAAAMDGVYTRFLGRAVDFEELVYEKKRLILRSALSSELAVLSNLLNRLSEQNRRVRDFTLGDLGAALREVIASFPVYRTYIDAHTGRVDARDRDYVEQAVRRARRHNPATSSSVFAFLRDVLLLRWPEVMDDAMRAEHARFVMKFQQLTGPVMAKGVEDTSFYLYNRLVSLNEVGGEPDVFGVEPTALHAWLARRAEQWPHALNATSTHDTKRSEDVRARIHLLSEMPEEWEARVRRWAALNADQRRHSEEEGVVPDRNDEYLFYQTLVGAWPLGELDDAQRESFVERLQQYMEKATREAKLHTSWINPEPEYDEGVRDFVAAVLDGKRSATFLADFAEFHPRIARLGVLNSLAQTLLKLTCAGVPDVYQGQEVFDFSLVDPDNRRPVDYGARRERLERLQARLHDGPSAALAAELLDNWSDGMVKLFVTHLALQARRRLPELFTDGAYLPLRAAGERAEHVFAFARRHGARRVLVVVPRLVATLYGEPGFAPGAAVWGDTRLVGESDVLTGRFRNLFTGAELAARDGALALGELLGEFPVALLEG